FSFIAGSVVLFLPKKIVNWFIGLLAIGLLILNFNYFLPDGGKMGPLTDKEKFAGAAWDLQRTAGIFDYLPKGAVTAPKEPMRALSEVMRGEVSTDDLKTRTNKASFSVDVVSNGATLRLGIFKFPNWKAYVDGKEIETYIPKEEMWGRMYIDVPKGEHEIVIKLLNTPLRNVSNIISLTVWLGLLGYLVLQFKRGRRNREV
ncbi:MAG: hypothetical protein NTV24_01630, partial [Candidatus Woesebacteria bacterium]|nr:hypothetical protein [Candidatus Woesebacteria bacterium]